MTIQAISTDNVASTSTASSTSKFSLGDYIAMGTSVAGPVTEASFMSSGNTVGASIASVTGSAIYSGATNSGSSSYMSSGLGLSGSSSYYTGGSSYSTDLGSLTGTTGTTSLDDLPDQISNSQAYLIGMQAELSQLSITFTGISNALSAKKDMDRSAIQNFK